MDEGRSVFRLPRLKLAQVAALAILQAFTLAALLLLLRALFDALASGPVDHRRVLGSIGLLVGIVLVHAAARGLEFAVAENMGYAHVRDLRMRMYRHLQGMSLRQLQGRSRGGLLLRFTGDLSMLRTWISRGLARGLVAIVVLLGVLGAVAYLNVRIAATIAGVLFLGSSVLSRLGPRLYRVTRKVRRRRSLLTSNIDEQLHAFAVVQVNGRSQGEHDRLSRQNDSMTEALFETSWLRGSMLGVSTATAGLAIAGVLVVGSIELAAGNASVGTVAAAVIACRQLTGPVRRLGLSYDYWQRAKVSRRKLLDFLESSSRPLDEDGKAGLRVHRGNIDVVGVAVTGALHDVTGTIPGGQIVAVVGPVGAGKSTLLNLVAGLVAPDRGDVVVDGHPLSERTLRSRFNRIGMVGPDLPLMRGTVRRNLTYRRPHASPEEVQRVLGVCRLDAVIAALPDGLETWLHEGGTNLSAGERQRLVLARALMGNPWILLLDEPTVNLDETSRQVIHEVIAHHRGTVLLATHDPNEACLADVVWVLDHGRLATTMSGEAYRDLRWRSRQEVTAYAT